MVNKVILIGNLGRDPEVKTTPSGASVATISVATTRKWKDPNGQQREETDWHNVVVWNGTADYVGKYLHQGSKVYVEGRLQTRSYEKNGEKRYSTEVVAGLLLGLDPRGEGGSRESRYHDRPPAGQGDPDPNDIPW